MRRLFCILTVILAAIQSQSSDLFREVSPKESKITWVHENGHSPNRYLPETTGAGVAIFDYNNDGWMDILFVNSGDSAFYHPSVPLKHALYRNNRDGTFTDVTQQAGITADLYAMGIAIGDFDGDGNEDIFISGYGKCVLYHNNGDGTFTDVTATSGIVAPHWGTSAVWFDYDNDGKLDLFVGEFADYSSLRSCQLAESYGGSADNLPREQAYYCNPKQFPPAPSHLYHNLGNGHFQDVSVSTGIAASPGKVWGVVATDINHDGYTDLFASNDTMANFLWVNQDGKKFEDVALEANVGYSADGMARSGMGVDAGDFDNDGLPDLLVANIDAQNTSLYKNRGDEVFQELNLQTGLAPVTRMLSGWGLRLFDYDNDGWQDLIQVNSHPDDLVDLRNRGVTYREPLVLLRNISGARLQDVSGTGGPAFSHHYAGRGLAVGDLNNDGAPDIVFTEVGGPPHVLMNNAIAGNNWLGLQLKAKRSNPAATGAIITWSLGGKVFSRIRSSGGSFLSSQDPREILGLGEEHLDWVEIQWPAPSHSVDRIEKPQINHYLQIVEGEHPPAKLEKSSAVRLPSARLLLVAAQESTAGRSLSEQAQAAFEQGNFSEAEQLLERAVKANPKDASLWFYLGASCMKLQHEERAIAAFERARLLAPRQSAPYFNLGLLYWRRGDVGKAKEAYQHGLALDPTDSGGLQNYSILLMKTGECKEAITPLLVLKKDPKLTLQARVGLIECYLKTGQSSKADVESDEVIRSGVAGPADQTKLAALLVEHGDPQAAEKILKNSLHLDPKQANANAALGAIYLAQKRFPEASASVQRAMQLAPDSSEYALVYVRTLLQWNHQQQLLDFLKTVEPKFGKLPEFRYAMALAYYGVTQFSDAANILEKLLLDNPRRQDQIYYLLGNSYLILGKFDQAEKAYRKAIEINPKDTAYYETFATLMRREGPQKLDDAILELKRAHQYDPEDPHIDLQLALCYEAKGDLPNAVPLAEKAVEREPDLTPAHVALSRIYFHLGKKTEGEREKNLVKELEKQQQMRRSSGGASESLIEQ